MPFKSKAQRRKFAQRLVDGEISPGTYAPAAVFVVGGHPLH